MATEKDKTIQWAIERSPNFGYHTDGMAKVFGAVWETARADAIEECAQFVDDYDIIETYGGYYNNDDARATLMKCAVALRSLSRKQEEPR